MFWQDMWQVVSQWLKGEIADVLNGGNGVLVFYKGLQSKCFKFFLYEEFQLCKHILA